MVKINQKRRQNENKFNAWHELAEGGRQYFYKVHGKHGWSARYVKEVDKTEQTIKFYQEIFNEHGQLVEIHEKYPVNKGHIKVQES